MTISLSSLSSYLPYPLKTPEAKAAYLKKQLGNLRKEVDHNLTSMKRSDKKIDSGNHYYEDENISPDFNLQRIFLGQRGVEELEELLKENLSEKKYINQIDNLPKASNPWFHQGLKYGCLFTSALLALGGIVTGILLASHLTPPAVIGAILAKLSLSLSKALVAKLGIASLASFSLSFIGHHSLKIKTYNYAIDAILIEIKHLAEIKEQSNLNRPNQFSANTTRVTA